MRFPKGWRVIIPPQFRFAAEFKEGLAWVRNNPEKHGFIDKTGKVVIPFEFDDTFDFSEGLAAVELNDK